MMNADSLIYKVAIVEELPIAENVSIWEIISICVSIIAVALSIYAIIESKKRDNTRKLKDFFISELEEVNSRLEELIKKLEDFQIHVTCQEIITNFQRIMMKLEVVLDMAESSLEVSKDWDSNALKLEYNEIRNCVTTADSFVAAYATADNVTLNKSEMIGLYSCMMKYYKKNIEHIRIINNVDSLKQKQKKK